ncbi:LysR family transcriptional regulator [Nocardioides sp. NPDC006273]|uniref:LysR family transcriptional regulator n=1 Tax=Nocardioides sp. NPDC006273 TaxID=3155598 RepID=UPI0033A4263B
MQRALSTDDLLVLLAVSRGRTFSAAGLDLGVGHTTVARRIRSLEKAMGGRLLTEAAGGWELTPLGEDACNAAREVEATLSRLGNMAEARPDRLRGLVRVSAPEIFMVEVVAPAVASVSAQHPELRTELVSVTRTTPLHGPSTDLDITPSKSPSRRLTTRRLADYQLGLFAARSYLEAHEPIAARSNLRAHTLVYYVESMVQVADLDLVDQFWPRDTRIVGATSVAAQARLTLAGAGIGLLPVYYARGFEELQPVLGSDAVATLSYWMTARQANLRRPETAEVAKAIALQADRFFGNLDPS